MNLYPYLTKFIDLNIKVKMLKLEENVGEYISDTKSTDLIGKNIIRLIKN